MIAIRGATTVERDRADDIRAATRELLAELARKNDLTEEEIVSALFTATPDLTACFPAAAARELGWTSTALMCAAEIAVRGALPRCIRVLLHVERARTENQVQHVYLRGAEALRPDLIEEEERQ